ncbi:MAG: hypothetical protein AAGK30_06395 [Pseudomonadota bacterium]
MQKIMRFCAGLAQMPRLSVALLCADESLGKWPTKLPAWVENHIGLAAFATESC